MKIAIVHDWLVINGGAEKVLKEIIELYPNADIFSIVDFLDSNDRKDILSSKFSKTTFIQKLPFSKRYFRYYFPLFPIAIESLDLSEYDLVISSSWAVAKGIITTNKQIHISYYQARNMKYIWDESDLYFTGIKRIFKPFFINYLRKFDIKSSKNADYIITNSKFVQDWVKDKYNRKSEVIYPPVDISRFTLNEEKQNYYLTVARLVSYKRVDLIVKAFNQMKDKKLIVVGDGDEFTSIMNIANENITMLGFLKGEELTNKIENAKAFVYCGVEDFGISPIEAIACGTPIIALNQGGTAETVIDGLNGIHFENQKIDDIINAVHKFENTNFDAVKIRNSSIKYTLFKQEFKNFVTNAISSKD